MAFSFHRIPVGICNCYLLRGEQTVLIDAGAWGGTPAFVRGMQALNVDPQEIDLILITHGHWDHITCLSDIRAMSGAQVAIHHRDQAAIETGRSPFPNGVGAYGRAMSALAKTLLHPKLPPVKVDVPIGDEGLSLAEYGIPGRVVHTPGHSPGHVSVVLDSGDALVGDMAMNDWYLRSTPGLPVLADDVHLMIASWRKILPMGIQTVYPAHGAEFPAAVIRKEIEAFQ
jgi:glyoxylase-like metal-dependent hydrolase (beta-lactamase superfamily II)